MKLPGETQACHQQTYPGDVLGALLRRPINTSLMFAILHVAATLPHSGTWFLQICGKTRSRRCTSILVTPRSRTCSKEKKQ